MSVFKEMFENNNSMQDAFVSANTPKIVECVSGHIKKKKDGVFVVQWSKKGGKSKRKEFKDKDAAKKFLKNLKEGIETEEAPVVETDKRTPTQCKGCKKELKSEEQLGTGYCSQGCADKGKNESVEAPVEEAAKKEKAPEVDGTEVVTAKVDTETPKEIVHDQDGKQPEAKPVEVMKDQAEIVGDETEEVKDEDLKKPKVEKVPESKEVNEKVSCPECGYVAQSQDEFDAEAYPEGHENEGHPHYACPKCKKDLEDVGLDVDNESKDVNEADEEEPKEEVEEPAEAPAEEPATEEPEAKPTDEKEYFGSKADNFYYLEAKGKTAILVDAEGKEAFKGNAEDMIQFIQDAVKALEIDSISIDVFDKYILPVIQEPEEIWQDEKEEAPSEVQEEPVEKEETKESKIVEAFGKTSYAELVSACKDALYFVKAIDFVDYKTAADKNDPSAHDLEMTLKDVLSRIDKNKLAEACKLLEGKSDAELYAFCREHYYAEVDGVEEKWEPFENWDDAQIEELIKNDVEALKRFLAQSETKESKLNEDSIKQKKQRLAELDRIADRGEELTPAEAEERVNLAYEVDPNYVGGVANKKKYGKSNNESSVVEADLSKASSNDAAKMSIEIDITESDLDELREGKEFNWTYPDVNGQGDVDVRLYNADLANEGKVSEADDPRTKLRDEMKKTIAAKFGRQPTDQELDAILDLVGGVKKESVIMAAAEKLIKEAKKNRKA